MGANELKKKVEDTLDALAQAMERGESEQLKAYLAAMGKFHRYSLGNALLIAWQRPDATRVAGFHTWRKLGRHVQRGEKGVRILAPILRRRKQGAEEEEAEEPNENRNDEEEERITFKSVVVFDVTQTSGEPRRQSAVRLLLEAVTDGVSDGIGDGPELRCGPACPSCIDAAEEEPEAGHDEVEVDRPQQ